MPVVEEAFTLMEVGVYEDSAAFRMWVWEALLDRDTIFGDHPDSDRYWVRLVRLGNLFQATH